MSTLLAIDPGIAATAKGDVDLTVEKAWLPDLGVLKQWVNDHYGPVKKSLAYVTYQPRHRVGSPRDDLSDSGRDQFTRFLEHVGYTDISRIESTEGSNGTLKCNVDTSIVRDIWSSMVMQEIAYSPLTGHHSRCTRGPYDTFVGVMGDWDIVRPLVTRERVTGNQPSLIDLGIKVVLMYKSQCTSRHILDLADGGVIEFVPLEQYRNELTRKAEAA
jgi:hypothetical protein